MQFREFVLLMRENQELTGKVQTLDFIDKILPKLSEQEKVFAFKILNKKYGSFGDIKRFKIGPAKFKNLKAAYNPGNEKLDVIDIDIFLNDTNSFEKDIQHLNISEMELEFLGEYAAGKLKGMASLKRIFKEMDLKDLFEKGVTFESILTDTPEFISYRPMLSKSVDELNQNFMIQPKIDGRRAIANNGRLYSRNGEDISEKYPEIVEVLLPEVVLDGELVLFKDGKYQSWKESSKKKNHHKIKYIIFDRMGDGLEDSDYWTRWNTLKHCTNDKILEIETWDPVIESYENFAQRQLDIGHNEGLIARDPKSKYLYDKRTLDSQKWKYSFEDIDAVIYKAEKGDNATTFYNTFYIRDLNGDELGKVGSGFKHHQMQDITDQNTDDFENTPEIALNIKCKIAHNGIDEESGKLRFPRLISFEEG